MTNPTRRQLLTAGALGAVTIPATAAGSPAAQGGPAAYAGAYPSNPVTTGAQDAAASGWSTLSGQRVGVITNR